MMLYKYKNYKPEIHESVFIADGAKIIGNVTIGKQSSIWFNVVIRGDEGSINIGNQCSLQENVVCHLYSDQPLTIENNVTVGHGAIIHGCTIKKDSLIGMGATILDGAVIEENSIIGANALVPPGKRVPANSIVFGNPGKVVQNITEEHRKMIELSVKTYVRNSKDYQNKNIFEKIKENDENL